MREKKSSYIAFFVHGYMVYPVLAVCTYAGFYSKVYRYCMTTSMISFLVLKLHAYCPDLFSS
jgi:hypothetical protein